jgi:hypothetical protein
LLSSSTNDDEISDQESQQSKKSFNKFVECTICLTQFKNGDPVKVVPGCSHVFHESCFNDWVALRFRCPNCNTEILIDGLGEERSRYNERIEVINNLRII